MIRRGLAIGCLALGCSGAGDPVRVQPVASVAGPVAVASAPRSSGAGQARQVAAGSSHTCALRIDGRVVCWGSNSLGALGDGSEHDRWAPQLVRGVQDAVELSVGGLSACVRTSAGGVWCWGRPPSIGGFGYVPKRIQIEEQVAEIAAGHEHACARLSGGAVHCWGKRGAAGQQQPLRVAGLPPARRLVSGDRHGCALDEIGGVWCWGSNDYGQLGDGANADRLTPARVAGVDAIATLWAKGATTYARSRDGALWAWGYDATRDWKANHERPRRPTKLAPPAIGGARVFGDERCFLDEAGLVACRTRDAEGRASGSYASVDFGGPVRQLALGTGHACALLAHGIQCFGDNREGQLGRGTAAEGVSSPTAIAGVDDAIQVVTGDWDACALRAGGTVSCWRKPALLGDNDDPNPRPIASLAGVTALHSGGQYNCAEGPDPQVRCWGLANWRPCQWLSPDNCQSERWTRPRAVSGLAGVGGGKQVVGECVLMPRGTVQCIERYRGGPAQVQPPLQSVAQLAGAAWLRCVRHTDGRVSCAFKESVGWHELPGVPDAIDVAASETHICVVRRGGQVQCTTPTPLSRRCGKHTAPCAKLHDVPLPAIAAEVVTGDGYSCARLRDGRVMCWGQGAGGVLGDGRTEDRGAPVAAVGLSDAVELDSGPAHVCARRRQGQVLCWGKIVAGLEQDATPAPILE